MTLDGIYAWAGLAGLACFLFSLVCSAINSVVRGLQDAGEVVPRWLRLTAIVANALAANIDKAGQLLRGGRGPSAPPVAP